MKYFAEFRLKNEIDKIALLPRATLEKVACTQDAYVCEYLYTVCVREGIYAGNKYAFQILFPEAYPFRSPRVRCLDRIFHPNIDVDGNVCLEFLRHNWSSAMGIEWILTGICLFLAEPCGTEALNIEAGNLLLTDYDEFVRRVRSHPRNTKH